MPPVADWGPARTRDARTRDVTWHAPSTLTAAAADLPGRELLQAIVDGHLPPPPMAELVGARLVSVGDGEVRFAWVPDESTYNPFGMVHGGLLCTLLDFAGGAAVHTPRRRSPSSPSDLAFARISQSARV